MSNSDFKSLFNELLDIDNKLGLLKRKQLLRNRLKIIGIGFLIHKYVQNEIEETLSRRKTILGNIDADLSAYVNSLRIGVEKIRLSNLYLPEDDESNWLKRIVESKEEFTYLSSVEALEKPQAIPLLAELEGFQQVVITHNAELEKKELRQQLLLLKPEILRSEKEYNGLYYGPYYFSKRDLNDWKMNWSELAAKIQKIEEKSGLNVDFRDSVERVIGAYRNGESWLKSRNAEFKASENRLFYDFFERDVERNPLTSEQRDAIVTDEVSNLVVAGAGTGKTSTIIGKAGYIIKKKLATPEEVLILSFNKDVSTELQERIGSKLGGSVQIHTYHRFGLRVITEATGLTPSVSEMAEDRAKFSKKIYELIRNRMKDPAFAKLATEYFLYYFTPYRSIPEFGSFREYVEYIKQVELRSLKGDKMKSFEECSIANFLHTNGIEYLYEKPYEIKETYIKHRRYRPDFYLPKYHLYIEHFGINRQGKTAPYVSQAEYRRQMQWKIDTHQKYGTSLIQTFSYEHTEGILLANLEEKLREKGVVFSPLAREQIFQNLEHLGRINQFSRLVANFLNLYKSSGKIFIDIAKEEKANDRRTKSFLQMFSAIYDDYTAFLKEAGEIDFNDMLNDATELILSGKYVSPFTYVLVDEFQDISHSRYRFLKALLDQNKSKLFAVGDDWQSIYRFTGSDISLMVDFEKNFEYSERSMLQETFRLNDKLCEFSTRFILQNPLQIKKHIRSTYSKSEPSVTITRGETRVKIKEILEDISQRSKEEQSVFIIGRYNKLKKDYLTDFPLKISGLSVDYTTAHSAKGLEADYVILIGVKGGIRGFPCQIVDDPLLDIVLAKEDKFPNAEERRLFYVALTRAKKHVYIIDDPSFTNSSFVLEILKGGYDIYSVGQPPKTALCPICETGQITAKDGRYGRFFQCSNYPLCDYTPKKCPRCGEGFLQKGSYVHRCSNGVCSFSADNCPVCSDGYLVKRQGGRGGYFFGCSNYPECKYIQRTNPSTQYVR